MLQIDLERKQRREIEQQLEVHIFNKSLRLFLMKNLSRQSDRFYWKIPLHWIADAMNSLMDFEIFETYHPYPYPTLFIGGDGSDYLQLEHQPVIESWFPQAQMKTIPEAGHWLHLDQPEKFLNLIRNFV